MLNHSPTNAASATPGCVLQLCVPNDDGRSLASVDDALDSASVRPQGSPVQARCMDCEATTSKGGRERVEVSRLMPQPVY